MTSFLLPPAGPAPTRVEASASVEPAADGVGAVERSLDERVPDLDPVLRKIARVAAELAAQPLVRDDAAALYILDRMAQAGDIEQFEALADALHRHLAALPAADAAPRSAAPAPSRMFLKL